MIEQAGVRSRAIEKKLRNVQELPKEESANMLDDIMDASFADEQEVG
ncbi:hypothetical protein [Paraflavitalea speifideaquila]|nr:hypothetical protein [Paraflavitalea speifideiaquila]